MTLYEEGIDSIRRWTGKWQYGTISRRIYERSRRSRTSHGAYWTISSKIKAFIERFYCIAEKDENPPLGRYEKYPIHDCALLMTSADNFFWTFEQAVSYYKFTMINYIGFHDKGVLLAGGCGDTNDSPQISKTSHLKEAFNFGKSIYANGNRQAGMTDVQH